MFAHRRAKGVYSRAPEGAAVNTLLIVLATWAALIAVIAVVWHQVMRRAHRQDARRVSSARVPAPRQPLSSPIATRSVD